MKNLIVSTLVTCALFSTAQANASVIFDFQELTDTNMGQISGTLANGNAFPLANSGEIAFDSFDWNKGGISLTASASYAGTGTYSDTYAGAYNAGDNLESWAYLDAGDAGLGVCSLGLKGNNQCNPNSDDNVTVNEVLQITFDQLVSIDFSQTVFKDDSHNVFSPLLDISLNNGSSWAFMDTSSTLISDSFYFRTNSLPQQFYVNVLAVASVPAPASHILFGMALVGFGLTRKLKAK